MSSFHNTMSGDLLFDIREILKNPVIRDQIKQAVQGLFTAGTSVAPDSCKTGKEQRKEKVGCKRGD